MSYQASEFLTSVVRPALVQIEKHSAAAEQLLLGTAIQESLLTYTQQVNGPALGYFQMEPNTHDDIWNNFLIYKKTLSGKIKAIANFSGKSNPSASLLETNDLYAAAMARIHYLRKKDPMPAENDIEAMAKYWKKHYNTEKGKGNAQEFVTKWKLFKAGNLVFGKPE